MKNAFAVLLCVICICVAGGLAQKGGKSNDAFAKFVNDSIKAQTDNDANWMKNNLADGYVEGTSFGTWIPKEQLIKDAGDPANNKFTKNDISEVQTQVIGNVGLARFKEDYDALIEGQHRARTIICSLTAEKQGSSWKALSTHCSKVE
ncbi:MAG: nuclear transport factor 2 family protein [Acidobacteria bacterium]|nr:nuclear transport factor 2 family protein [Acidobacteriota bacterium]MBV9148067.1 nuclear transport factor 2 family protein [Acidobacteriota bacterium]MBV9436325.1 nuclear transport factor 2 family protein [Acidobacteriota bacterium]